MEAILVCIYIVHEKLRRLEIKLGMVSQSFNYLLHALAGNVAV